MLRGEEKRERERDDRAKKERERERDEELATEQEKGKNSEREAKKKASFSRNPHGYSFIHSFTIPSLLPLSLSCPLLLPLSFSLSSASIARSLPQLSTPLTLSFTALTNLQTPHRTCRCHLTTCVGRCVVLCCVALRCVSAFPSPLSPPLSLSVLLCLCEIQKRDGNDLLFSRLSQETLHCAVCVNPDRILCTPHDNATQIRLHLISDRLTY